MTRPLENGQPRIRDGMRLEAYLQLGQLRRDDHLRPITVQRRVYEGYPAPEYSIEGLTIDDLQRLADWMIVQTPQAYRPLEATHRALERILLADRERT